MLREKFARNNDVFYQSLKLGELAENHRSGELTMAHITVTRNSKIDTARPNLTLADIETLLPFTITGIPEILSDAERDALSTLVCQALVPLRPSINALTASSPLAGTIATAKKEHHLL